ncbi:hypothetical protein KJ682_03690 [bacterium]|nr:hypothetical protein [bacterium]
MPLTGFQARLGRLLAGNRSEDSYLAGGAAILAAPNSRRFSHDLDYFHDTVARVASAFTADRELLTGDGLEVEIEISQPGYIRAVVGDGESVTKIEWAQDSAWRFMPVMESEDFGFQLHPVDLATNKVLALAGREEPRDLLDTLFLHETLLPLGPLVWAAVGKDPGYSPLSLLEMLKRRGRIRQEDLERLDLTGAPDVQRIKADWTDALQTAEDFIRRRPPAEAGCLYYSPGGGTFVDPDSCGWDDVLPHFGHPGGILPRMIQD